MSLTMFRPSESRVVAMRPSTRDGLYALASAWHASTGSNVRPFTRPVKASTPEATADATAPEPPYWPDGPSAA